MVLCPSPLLSSDTRPSSRAKSSESAVKVLISALDDHEKDIRLIAKRDLVEVYKKTENPEIIKMIEDALDNNVSISK